MSNLATKIELNSVIVAVADSCPYVLIDPHFSLPSGPFESDHRTLEQGLRAWAKMPLGYLEQLYTFADKGRILSKQRLVSIGYLALMRYIEAPQQTKWSSWYQHFPWEDCREGTTPHLTRAIWQALAQWKNDGPSAAVKALRSQRIDIAFPKNLKNWNDELVLQRYELLWEAGLVDESSRSPSRQTPDMGIALAHDHRRILATAIARLRAKIKYRPVVFELLPDRFTLLQLQQTVEALAGLKLHKQNFRRLIESQHLVEETGAMTHGGSGRPAKLYAFRREVLQERSIAGTKLPRTS